MLVALTVMGLGTVVGSVDLERKVTSLPSWIGSLANPAAKVPAAQSTRGRAGGATARDAGFEAQLRELHAEVQELRGALAQLEHGQTHLERELRDATAGVATLAAAPGRKSEGVAAGRMISASLLLREAAQSAAPFARELGAVAALTADRADSNASFDRAALTERIAQLRPYAETGMATRRDLRRSFAGVVEAVDRTGTPSWWESVLVLIGWRSDPRASVHDAATALLYDDLAGAADSLATLTGESAAAAEGWLTLARARLAIDDAVASLYRSTLVASGAPAVPDEALASVRATAASVEFE
jgi:hypothetical protein